MAQLDLNEPSRVLRGTWDEVLSHAEEISKSSAVELRVFEPMIQTATMALIKSWLEEESSDDPEEIRADEEDLQEFKRNMNRSRRASGAEILYPEVEKT